MMARRTTEQSRRGRKRRPSHPANSARCEPESGDALAGRRVAAAAHRLRIARPRLRVHPHARDTDLRGRARDVGVRCLRGVRNRLHPSGPRAQHGREVVDRLRRLGLVRTAPTSDATASTRYATPRSAYCLLAIPVCALALWSGPRLPDGRLRLSPLHPVAAGVQSRSLFLATWVASCRRWSRGAPFSLWDHKGGNIAVHVAIALAFLWLIPGAGGRYRPLMTTLAVAVLLADATQTRGGFRAAVAGLLWVWVLTRRRGRMTLVAISTMFCLVLLAWGFNVRSVAVRIARSRSASSLRTSERDRRRESDSDGKLRANRQFRETSGPACGRGEKREACSHRTRFRARYRQGISAFRARPTSTRSPQFPPRRVRAMGVIGLA